MLHCIALKDAKTGHFHPPSFVDTIPSAMRDLIMHIRDNPKSRLSQFPADFSLWRLGSFMEDSGIIEPLSGPEHVCPLAELAMEAKK